MQDQNAASLLAKVMAWTDLPQVATLEQLQLLADYKYDHYQRFEPGRRFVESLALWLDQFDATDRSSALDFVVQRLVYFSDAELSHLVRTAYRDLIVPERLRLVGEELDIPQYRVRTLAQHPRSRELQLKSLYLGLSDGARTNELRRASDGEIGNEQIWQAYELSDQKAADMVDDLRRSLASVELESASARFNLVWLLDDFSGSGNTYIRYDHASGQYKGKIKKIFERLGVGDLVDVNYYEVYLVLYSATRQAIDHIEYWSDRFTSDRGYKPLRVRVLFPLESSLSQAVRADAAMHRLLQTDKYRDNAVVDKHFLVGGTSDARFGFAGCALPVVLAHNTPNNSLYMLWGPEHSKSFVGLFPRVSRHREF